MLNAADKDKVRQVVRVHWLIYFSFVTAVIMYGFVIALVTKDRTIDAPFDIGLLRRIFLLASVVIAAAKFWLQSRFLSDEFSYRKCRSLDEIIGMHQRYYFIILALCEAPALFGLVIAFLTMRLDEWWVFFGICAFLFATSVPRLERLERIAEAQAAHWQAVPQAPKNE
jgi:F0F1-type ATP synthase membrane subunit c/vacuolar-type H+-ATPase subunit K